VLVVASVLATVHGSHDGAPLRFLISAIALFYLTVALLRRDSDARTGLAFVALITVAISGLAGVEQIAQHVNTGHYRDGFTPVVTIKPRPDLLPRAEGTFDNPNLLAAHVLLLAPIAALGAAWLGTRSLRLVGMGIVALAVLGLLFTFSRAGAVAALVGLGAFAAATRPAWRPRLLAVAVAGLVAILLGSAVSGGDLAGGFGRPTAWKQALSTAGDNPTTGVGLGRAGDVMTANNPKDHYNHAHNLWLTWLVDAGPLALLAWLAITGWLLVIAFQDAVRRRPLAAAGLVALTGFFLFSLADHPANLERISLTFWFVAALVAARLGAGGMWPPVGSRRRRRPAPMGAGQ
jgi:hypothetical protein